VTAQPGGTSSFNQIERERRLPIAIKIGPVHGNDDFLARSNQMRNPAGEAVPYVDFPIAEQPVNLLDRVLAHQTARLRQRLPDHRNR
jgi:hypothetical protein